MTEARDEKGHSSYTSLASHLSSDLARSDLVFEVIRREAVAPLAVHFRLGYIKNAILGPDDPGSAMSCAEL